MRRFELRKILKENKQVMTEGLNLGNVGLGALALVAGAGLLFTKGILNFAQNGDVFKGNDRGWGSSNKGVFGEISSLFTKHLRNSKSKDVSAIAEKMRQMRLALSQNPEKDLPGVVDTILEFAEGPEKTEEVSKKINEDTLEQLRVYNIWNTRGNEILKAKKSIEKNDKADENLKALVNPIKSLNDISAKTILDFDDANGFTRKLSNEEKEILKNYGDNKITLSMDDIREVWNICQKIIKKQYEEFRKEYIGLVDKIGDMDANKAKELINRLQNVDKELYNELERGISMRAKESKEKDDEDTSDNENLKKLYYMMISLIINMEMSRAGSSDKNDNLRSVISDLIKVKSYKDIENNIDDIIGNAENIFSVLLKFFDGKDEKYYDDNLMKIVEEEVQINEFVEDLKKMENPDKLSEEDSNKILQDIKKISEGLKKLMAQKKESFNKLLNMFNHIKMLKESCRNMRSVD